MFYKNYLNLKKMTYKKYNYASFSGGINTEIDEKLLPIKYSKNTYNFNYSTGALTTGLGISALNLSYSKTNRNLKKTFSYPSGVGILGTWIFTKFNDYTNTYDDFIVFYGNNNKIYYGYMYTANTAVLELSGVTFSSIPKVINYNLNGSDVVIMANVEDGMWVWDGYSAPYQVSTAPAISSMCMHYERLFATVSKDKRSLFFSDDLDPTNWTMSLSDGGFITMADERGTCNKVVSYNDNLYVFREFGIAKVTAFANQEEFSVTQLFTSSNRIYENTITLCGDRIMFLASDGVYYFNGVTTTKLSLGIESMINCIHNDNAIGVYFDGSFYIALALNYFDDETIGCESGTYSNNSLLKINLKTGEMTILRGADIVNMNTLNDVIENALMVVVKDGNSISLGLVDNSGKIFSSNTKKVWSSPMFDFSKPQSQKFLKSLTLTTDSDITVKIHADSKIKNFTISGSGLKTIYPNLKAYEFGIDFIVESATCKVSNPQIIVGVWFMMQDNKFFANDNLASIALEKVNQLQLKIENNEINTNYKEKKDLIRFSGAPSDSNYILTYEFNAIDNSLLTINLCAYYSSIVSSGKLTIVLNDIIVLDENVVSTTLSSVKNLMVFVKANNILKIKFETSESVNIKNGILELVGNCFTKTLPENAYIFSSESNYYKAKYDGNNYLLNLYSSISGLQNNTVISSTTLNNMLAITPLITLNNNHIYNSDIAYAKNNNEKLCLYLKSESYNVAHEIVNDNVLSACLVPLYSSSYKIMVVALLSTNVLKAYFLNANYSVSKTLTITTKSGYPIKKLIGISYINGSGYGSVCGFGYIDSNQNAYIKILDNFSYNEANLTFMQNSIYLGKAQSLNLIANASDEIYAYLGNSGAVSKIKLEINLLSINPCIISKSHKVIFKNVESATRVNGYEILWLNDLFTINEI